MIAFGAANHYAGFVATDLALLRRLESVLLLPARRSPAPWAKLRSIRRADRVYGWFADLSNLDTALLSRALRKRFILAVAGYELANLPALGYGLQRRRFSRVVVRRCFRLADALLFLHESLRHEAESFDPPSSEKMTVVPPGFDGEAWFSDDQRDRTTVSTVIAADTPARFHVKGGPMILDVARAFPARSFVMVGLAPQVQQAIAAQAPPNVRLLGLVAAPELRSLYQSTTVFLQLSVREVFPNAVCEAMLCGAVPVVSPLPVMREVVDGAGFVAGEATVEAYQASLREAIDRADGLRRAAREHILATYPLERRFDRLREILGP